MHPGCVSVCVSRVPENRALRDGESALAWTHCAEYGTAWTWNLWYPKKGSVDLGYHTRCHTRYALGTHTHQHKETPPHSNGAKAHTRQVTLYSKVSLDCWLCWIIGIYNPP